MTHELLINRYNQVTPTHIQPNGCSVSTPIYITPTTDQAKSLLNAFRGVVANQRDANQQVSSETTGVSVVTAVKAPMTPAEEELGMTEEALRYALFQRKGIPERLILKLQKITGIELVTREAIEQTLSAWLDENELDVKKRTKRTNKTSKTSTDTSVAS